MTTWISIDKKSEVPMIRQLYSRVREAILSGRLPPATRLPSSRELARELRISRNVVLEAYDLLYAEGFLDAKRGAGTYVAEGAAFSCSRAISAPSAEKVTMGYDCPPDIINFRAGTPNLSLFPKRLWLRLQKEAMMIPSEEMLAYGHPEGCRELREAICQYVVTQREVICHPDQIVITGGTTQAIGIACHLLLGERRDVVLEDPITRDIQLIVKSHGGVLHPVPVDSDGMQTAELPAHLAPAFVYVTPSHQFPIGGTLSSCSTTRKEPGPTSSRTIMTVNSALTVRRSAPCTAFIPSGWSISAPSAKPSVRPSGSATWCCRPR